MLARCGMLHHIRAAGAAAALGPRQPGIDAMLDLLEQGRAYIKISGARRILVDNPARLYGFGPIAG